MRLFRPGHPVGYPHAYRPRSLFLRVRTRVNRRPRLRLGFLPWHAQWWAPTLIFSLNGECTHARTNTPVRQTKRWHSAQTLQPVDHRREAATHSAPQRRRTICAYPLVKHMARIISPEMDAAPQRINKNGCSSSHFSMNLAKFSSYHVAVISKKDKKDVVP